ETREDNNARMQSWGELPFPATSLLDDFGRVDGSLASPWSGSVGQFAIRDSDLVLTGRNGYAVWNFPPFGIDQEAWVALDSIDPSAPEHDLLLKVQGPSWT